MSASFFFFLVSFFILLASLIFWTTDFSVSFNFLSIPNFSFFPFSFMMDSKMIWFLLMIFFVTSMVSLYGELYMEHYNNVKFLFLMISFFLSMFFLVVSESCSSFLTFWDFLGLTSLALIMFYPNKTTAYNSFMTSFFNRLGDIILVFCGSVYFWFPTKSFMEFYSLDYILPLLFVCGLTKSAQFPMSSWLPAAMSAPTPISAMVHSSTLVTAGVLIYQKFCASFELFSMEVFLLSFGSLTFLVGGALATHESDFKKIVAFSTMSQISMIVLFCGLLLTWVSISHMFFHALFKTLLFCSVGLYLLSMLGNQNSNTLNLEKSEKFMTSLAFFSVFSMTGLTFSSSFYSKDLALEQLIFCNDFSGMLLILGGSILTILYSGKIFNFLSSFSKIFSSFGNKKNYSWFFIIFSLVTVTLGPLVNKLSYNFYLPSVTFFEVSTPPFLFFFFLTLSIPVTKLFLYLSHDISSLKSSTFSTMAVHNSFKLSENFSMDHMFFKPISLSPLPFFLKKDKVSLWWVLVFFVATLSLGSYPVSLWEHSFEAAEGKG